MSRLSDDTEVLTSTAAQLAPFGTVGQGDNVADATAATATNPTAPAALTQSAAPAGGTGATAGAYDDATNRDLMIASVNAGRTDLIALRAEVITYEVAISALILDVAEIRTKVNAILASLEAAGSMATS